MNATREEYIAGLRDLADYLEQNPAVPTEAFPGSILVHAFGKDDEAEHALVDAAAAAMGVVAEGDTYYAARREFGPFSYEVLAVSQSQMAEYNEISELGKAAYGARRAEAAAAESDLLPTGCRVMVVEALSENESINGREGVVTEHLATGSIYVQLDGDEGSREVRAVEPLPMQVAV